MTVFLNCLVIGVAIANLAMFGWIIAIGLRIARGPVAIVRGRTVSLIDHGKTLYETALDAFDRNKERVTELWKDAAVLRRLLSVESFVPSPEGAVVTLASITAAIRTFKSYRSGLAGIVSVLNRIRPKRRSAEIAAEATASAGKTGGRRRGERQSLAMRLGLVPPAAKHLPVVLQAVRVARGVLASRRKG